MRISGCSARQTLTFGWSARQKGIVEIMPPDERRARVTRNAELTAQLCDLGRSTMRRGSRFDSSTGFKLPNGATRSPDASWIRNERWNALTTQEQEDKFAPLCPDFVDRAALSIR